MEVAQSAETIFYVGFQMEKRSLEFCVSGAGQLSNGSEQLRTPAFDQRGHGQSSRRPSGVLRADYVADVVEVINHFDQG